MMQLKIEPSLFRDINNYVKADKVAYEDVSIEVQDMTVQNKDGEENK